MNALVADGRNDGLQSSPDWVGSIAQFFYFLDNNLYLWLGGMRLKNNNHAEPCS
jgi:hypothetical protein